MINPKIAELIGAHCGDGTLYKTSRGLVWELRGELTEKGYYFDNICPLLKEIFDLEINSKFRSGGANGCWGVQTSNKKITSFFLDHGFVPGTKTYTVSVPDYVLKANIETRRTFVRGLFDTDGCLRFDRINKQKKHSYPRLEFGFASILLRDTLQILLINLGFRSFVWDDNNNKYYRLCISGILMLERWMEEIQPKNPKHLKKYKFWKNNGFYVPKTINNATVA
jgi:hypothetical protein